MSTSRSVSDFLEVIRETLIDNGDETIATAPLERTPEPEEEEVAEEEVESDVELLLDADYSKIVQYVHEGTLVAVLAKTPQNQWKLITFDKGDRRTSPVSPVINVTPAESSIVSSEVFAAYEASAGTNFAFVNEEGIQYKIGDNLPETYLTVSKDDTETLVREASIAPYQFLIIAAGEYDDITPDERATDILSHIRTDGDLVTFSALSTYAGVAELFEGEEEYTVFAPTDAAFEAAGVTLASLGISEDGTAVSSTAPTKESVASLILYHVVPGAVGASQVPTEPTDVTTLQGDPVNIGREAGIVYVGHSSPEVSTVIEPDHLKSNGVFHKTDSVLIPPTEVETTLTPSQNPSYSTSFSTSDITKSLRETTYAIAVEEAQRLQDLCKQISQIMDNIYLPNTEEFEELEEEHKQYAATKDYDAAKDPVSRTVVPDTTRSEDRSDLLSSLRMQNEVLDQKTASLTSLSAIRKDVEKSVVALRALQTV